MTPACMQCYEFPILPLEELVDHLLNLIGLGGRCTTAPIPRSVVPCLLSKHEVWAMAHRTDNLSISLSFITLMILQSIQVPNARGTHLKNSDSLGMMRKTTSSSYPAISATQAQRMMNPNGLGGMEEALTLSVESTDQGIDEPILVKEHVRLGPFQTQILE